MKIKGMDFPRPILNALRDSRLVVFAGAGVSMGSPAELPSFRKLAEAIAQGTGEELKDNEPEDRFLGRLSHKGVNVHAVAAARLKRNCQGEIPRPTDLHRNLLRIYSNSEWPLIVTTNFDLLFEQAAKDVFETEPKISTGPALPLGSEFNGIVHVHGSLGRPRDMVLTDADFGRAYLTEGWARRFLVEVFRTYTVLFVGYSHSDTIMNYLARALPVEETESRFVLTHEDEGSRWQFLGIEPIRYCKLPGNDHTGLYVGVSGLADYASRSILDWQREITEIAGKPPPLDEEEIDLIEDALKDPVKTRFFTAEAVSVEWIDWLDKRHHLANLFGTTELSERDLLLVQWLAEKFARTHPDELFLLIGRRYVHPHPIFWDALCRSIASKDDTPCDADTLSRWISLLLATAPAQLDKEHLLFWLGECCVKNELLDRVVDVFDAMAASSVVVKRGVLWPDSDEEEQSPRIDVELGFVSEHFTINKLWIDGLKPNLDRVAEPLLASVIRHLTTQHRTLSAWQEATRDWNSASFSRSAIEPHEQDKYPQAIDVLIDSARDCLEWLASNRPQAAAQWCNRLAREESPLLRRLAVHTLSVRNDLNPSEKIDWLLSRVDLNDFSAHHELFVVLKKTYSDADDCRRKAVIEAIQAHRLLAEEDDDTEIRTAVYHFQWFHWLHTAAHNCPLTREALDDVRRMYPELQPSKHPDLPYSISSVPGSHKRPWTVQELLSRPAGEWSEELVSFQQTGFTGPDRLGLRGAVSEAARQEFEWSLDLADALHEKGNWDTDLWETLMQVWSETALDENGTRKVLQRLEWNELHPNCARTIAEFLYKLVKDNNAKHTVRLLPQANKIAANSWSHIDRSDVRGVSDNWFTTAINHPAGFLAGFWLSSLYCWRKQHDNKPESLSEEYRDALSEIVKDKTVAGRLGRSVLARDLSFLLHVDTNWTETNLIPLFTRHANDDDYQALWHGFLYGRLSPPVAELMGDALLDAVSRIERYFSGQEKKLFIQHYVTMLADYVDDPLKDWIPGFFEHAGGYARVYFGITIENRLKHMNDTQQQEWWERWLKCYWMNRLRGVPRPLDVREMGIMFCWLADLKGVFPEAVDLAGQMQLEEFTDQSADCDRIVFLIAKGDLWKRHPEAVAKLLIDLGRIKSRTRAWSNGKELIDKLLKADLSCELKQQMKELAAERGMT